MKWLTGLLFLALIFGQFKSEKELKLESILMAPCCGGGTLAEHEENRYSHDMKQIMFALTDSVFDKQKVKELFDEAYSDRGIYQLHFAPATKSLKEIQKYVDENVHAGMTLDEIVDVFAWIHGEVIRSSPKHEGFGNLVWYMPLIILLVGVGVITLIVRRFVKRQKAQPVTAQAPDFDPELSAKIEKEIKELDL
ncbi:MAG: cytochrome c-type biogenesis protein CcmH [FCB group bacterium]|nr:cytochrome c-type biogenesis protein CcmH [FCB group bacterium]